MAKKQAKPKADPLPGQPGGRGWQPVPGVTLRLTLRGHTGWIGRIAWSPDGKWLASPSQDRTVQIWDGATGNLVRTLERHSKAVLCVAWSPDGRWLASSGEDRDVVIWDMEVGEVFRVLDGHTEGVSCILWIPPNERYWKGASIGQLHSGAYDGTVRYWDGVSADTQLIFQTDSLGINAMIRLPNGELALATHGREICLLDPITHRANHLFGHDSSVSAVSWVLGEQGGQLISGSDDETLLIWVENSGRPVRSLEGHTDHVRSLTGDTTGRIIASKGGPYDNTVRLWRCDKWQELAVIPEVASLGWCCGIEFHPFDSLLATVGSDINASAPERDCLIHLWHIDVDQLLDESDRTNDSSRNIHYATAKIVLVGDSGVGKTGLGWRLAHGEFKEHASTHGQQFWVVDQLGGQRKDGTRCEAVLWDLAGQPDYRLIHALFLDDADLALVLFDPTDQRDPLGSAEYWIKQLPDNCPKILVAARVDRGHVVLTNEELDNFCQRHNIAGGWIETSAKADVGVDVLLDRMKARIPWDRKTAVTTTATFKRIKDFVLALKQNRTGQQIVFTPAELRQQLERKPRRGEKKAKSPVPLGAFTDAEMLTAVERLASHGFVRLLKLSNGQQRILLVPELLNNLASSFVLEARRNERGLGALEERRLLDHGYRFPELEGLSKKDDALLLDATITAFLENRLSYRCFRESWGEAKLLIFPELMKLKKPERDDLATEEGVSYAVTGATENTFAGVVVLLGYTNAFLRTDQAQDVAYYEYETGQICGVRQIPEASGERTFVLFFNPQAGKQARDVFEGLVEKILGQKKVAVRRLRPARCPYCQTTVDRAVMSRRLKLGKTNVGCEECFREVVLPPDEPLRLPPTERDKVAHEKAVAEFRTRFEAVAFDVQRWVQSEERKSPICFVSYAWGNRAHERWVEHHLAKDLHKGGIKVILDRWENHPGADLPGFVERIDQSDFVLIVGTPAYLKKYKNKDPQTGTVVAAEMSLVNTRLLGTEAQKATVIPLLLEGSPDESLPPLLRPRVSSDFRDDGHYFDTVFALLLGLHRIELRDQVAQQWRQKLGSRGFEQGATRREFDAEDSSSANDARI